MLFGRHWPDIVILRETRLLPLVQSSDSPCGLLCSRFCQKECFFREFGKCGGPLDLFHHTSSRDKLNLSDNVQNESCVELPFSALHQIRRSVGVYQRQGNGERLGGYGSLYDEDDNNGDDDSATHIQLYVVPSEGNSLAPNGKRLGSGPIEIILHNQHLPFLQPSGINRVTVVTIILHTSVPVSRFWSLGAILTNGVASCGACVVYPVVIAFSALFWAATFSSTRKYVRFIWSTRVGFCVNVVHLSVDGALYLGTVSRGLISHIHVLAARMELSHWADLSVGVGIHCGSVTESDTQIFWVVLVSGPAAQTAGTASYWFSGLPWCSSPPAMKGSFAFSLWQNALTRITTAECLIFRASATVSRIGLMESCTCNCVEDSPPQLADPPGWPPPTWWMVGTLGLCADQAYLLDHVPGYGSFLQSHVRLLITVEYWNSISFPCLLRVISQLHRNGFLAYFLGNNSNSQPWELSMISHI